MKATVGRLLLAVAGGLSILSAIPAFAKTSPLLPTDCNGFVHFSAVPSAQQALVKDYTQPSLPFKGADDSEQVILNGFRDYLHRERPEMQDLFESLLFSDLKTLGEIRGRAQAFQDLETNNDARSLSLLMRAAYAAEQVPVRIRGKSATDAHLTDFYGWEYHKFLKARDASRRQALLYPNTVVVKSANHSWRENFAIGLGEVVDPQSALKWMEINAVHAVARSTNRAKYPFGDRLMPKLEKVIEAFRYDFTETELYEIHAILASEDNFPVRQRSAAKRLRQSLVRQMFSSEGGDFTRESIRWVKNNFKNFDPEYRAEILEALSTNHSRDALAVLHDLVKESVVTRPDLKMAIESMKLPASARVILERQLKNRSFTAGKLYSSVLTVIGQIRHSRPTMKSLRTDLVTANDARYWQKTINDLLVQTRGELVRLIEDPEYFAKMPHGEAKRHDLLVGLAKSGRFKRKEWLDYWRTNLARESSDIRHDLVAHLNGKNYSTAEFLEHVSAQDADESVKAAAIAAKAEFVRGKINLNDPDRNVVAAAATHEMLANTPLIREQERDLVGLEAADATYYAPDLSLLINTYVKQHYPKGLPGGLQKFTRADKNTILNEYAKLKGKLFEKTPMGYQLADFDVDLTSGLFYTIYKPLIKDAAKPTIIAFAGTKDKRGVIADITMGRNQINSKFLAEKLDPRRGELAQTIMALLADGQSVQFAGHSLGGAIAQAVAFEMQAMLPKVATEYGKISVTTSNAFYGGVSTRMGRNPLRLVAQLKNLAAEMEINHYQMKGDVVAMLVQQGVHGTVHIVKPTHTSIYLGIKQAHDSGFIVDVIRSGRANVYKMSKTRQNFRAIFNQGLRWTSRFLVLPDFIAWGYKKNKRQHLMMASQLQQEINELPYEKNSSPTNSYASQTSSSPVRLDVGGSEELMDILPGLEREVIFQASPGGS